MLNLPHIAPSTYHLNKGSLPANKRKTELEFKFQSSFITRGYFGIALGNQRDDIHILDNVFARYIPSYLVYCVLYLVPDMAQTRHLVSENSTMSTSHCWLCRQQGELKFFLYRTMTGHRKCYFLLKAKKSWCIGFGEQIYITIKSEGILQVTIRILLTSDKMCEHLTAWKAGVSLNCELRYVVLHELCGAKENNLDWANCARLSSFSRSNTMFY